MTFFANFLFLYGNLWKLKRFFGSLYGDLLEQPGAKHHGIFTHTHKKTDKKKLRAKVQLHDVTLSGLTRPDAEDLFQLGGCRCQILGSFGD